MQLVMQNPPVQFEVLVASIVNSTVVRDLTLSFDRPVCMRVVEEDAALILRVEGSLKMDADSSADVLVPVYRSKYYHIPEDSNI